MNNKNSFTKNILNEVRNYYANKRNYLKEEDYSIEDSSIMGMDQSNIPDMISNALSKGQENITVNNSSITVHTPVEDFNIFNDGTAEEADTHREINLPDNLISQALNFLQNYGLVSESIMEVTPNDDNNDDERLLKMAIQAYEDSTNVEVYDCDMKDQCICLHIADAKPYAIDVTTDFDYELVSYTEVPDTYDEPGYVDATSRASGSGYVTVFIDDTDEEQTFTSPLAKQFSDRIAKGYTEYFEDKYLQNYDPHDYDPY